MEFKQPPDFIEPAFEEDDPMILTSEDIAAGDITSDNYGNGNEVLWEVAVAEEAIVDRDTAEPMYDTDAPEGETVSRKFGTNAAEMPPDDADDVTVSMSDMGEVDVSEEQSNRLFGFLRKSQETLVPLGGAVMLQAGKLSLKALEKNLGSLRQVPGYDPEMTSTANKLLGGRSKLKDRQGYVHQDPDPSRPKVPLK